MIRAKNSPKKGPSASNSLKSKLEKYFRFKKKFGWAEGIALLALVVALLGFCEYRALRRGSLPNISVMIDDEDSDKSDVKEDGTGTFIYYYKISITNLGGRTATLRGFLSRHNLPLVVLQKGHTLLNRIVPIKIYLLDKPSWRRVIKDRDFLEAQTPTTLEQLGSLNIPIPPGRTKTIPFVLLIQNPNVPVDGYYLSIRMVFNEGSHYPLDRYLMVHFSRRDEERL